jgi:hypothetical protein
VTTNTPDDKTDKTPIPGTDAIAAALADVNRALNALKLEVDASIVTDIRARVLALGAAYERAGTTPDEQMGPGWRSGFWDRDKEPHHEIEFPMDCAFNYEGSERDQCGCSHCVAWRKDVTELRAIYSRRLAAFERLQVHARQLTEAAREVYEARGEVFQISAPETMWGKMEALGRVLAAGEPSE